jgi:Acyl-CoA reductase (LuxC)
MNIKDRIKSLNKWANQIKSLPSSQLLAIFQKAEENNKWFTQANCQSALAGIMPWLDLQTLIDWTDRYEISDLPTGKTIGLVMAGNIPLVGFHDLLCVLVSGHTAKIKLSSQDNVLLPYLLGILTGIDDRWVGRFSLEDRLNNVDAVIATGSDNSARYFEYYFRHIPKIIRMNRTSVAVIMGEESEDEFKALAKDVFTYFGLGCRNISKLYVPSDFDFPNLIKSFGGYREIINHNKYGNNYDYQRAIRLISGKKFLDGEFFLLEDSTELVSPISVLFFEVYESVALLQEMLKAQENKIQCIVSAKGWFKGSLPFGEAQNPAINDYADNVDTMKFLTRAVG